ncbi:hypothetical protein ADM98_10450 [Exiguobacterium sp. BMC-KP]|uniref:hypothetical protein n=1 Tax=Exiguobacterium sp. BMC-KP TaxID=1684312 RepID=UPI0006AA1FFC|nr:hypothetical protein [Exiguobacterium sp. BMC-KP]KOP29296.1 hypothetical protein ADM98_10450 [Exiguobacterium sp. BMC-KP]
MLKKIVLHVLMVIFLISIIKESTSYAYSYYHKKNLDASSGQYFRHASEILPNLLKKRYAPKDTKGKNEKMNSVNPKVYLFKEDVKAAQLKKSKLEKIINDVVENIKNMKYYFFIISIVILFLYGFRSRKKRNVLFDKNPYLSQFKLEETTMIYNNVTNDYEGEESSLNNAIREAVIRLNQTLPLNLRRLRSETFHEWCKRIELGTNQNVYYLTRYDEKNICMLNLQEKNQFLKDIIYFMSHKI